jgi:hypothetical protein
MPQRDYKTDLKKFFTFFAVAFAGFLIDGLGFLIHQKWLSWIGVLIALPSFFLASFFVIAMFSYKANDKDYRYSLLAPDREKLKKAAIIFFSFLGIVALFLEFYTNK